MTVPKLDLFLVHPVNKHQPFPFGDYVWRYVVDGDCGGGVDGGSVDVHGGL